MSLGAEPLLGAASISLVAALVVLRAAYCGGRGYGRSGGGGAGVGGVSASTPLATANQLAQRAAAAAPSAQPPGDHRRRMRCIVAAVCLARAASCGVAFAALAACLPNCARAVGPVGASWVMALTQTLPEAMSVSVYIYLLAYLVYVRRLVSGSGGAGKTRTRTFQQVSNAALYTAYAVLVAVALATAHGNDLWRWLACLLGPVSLVVASALVMIGRDVTLLVRAAPDLPESMRRVMVSRTWGCVAISAVAAGLRGVYRLLIASEVLGNAVPAPVTLPASSQAWVDAVEPIVLEVLPLLALLWITTRHAPAAASSASRQNAAS